MYKIAYDRAQKANKHEIKHNWLRCNGYNLIDLPLPVGDYIAVTGDVEEVIGRRGDKLKKMDLLGVTAVTIDTKQGLGEVCSNICGKSHSRFRDEAILAQINNIKFVVLVEHSRYVKSIDDVANWKNPRRYQYEKMVRKEWSIPRDADFQSELAELKLHGAKITRGPTTGAELAKSMRSMSEKYGIVWEFCDKNHTGEKIVELLFGDMGEKRMHRGCN
ncbi:hypothetical protein [uncultured Robinsoniella sp.]|uniref:hypothetical protein n=1 Tax=uncultured Robinsoniella sp. TaxID=904190 RepID=UPI00205D55A5|nr:MAG TPA: ERCC4 domain protein [Caudoviricetes sp.]